MCDILSDIFFSGAGQWLISFKHYPYYILILLLFIILKMSNKNNAIYLASTAPFSLYFLIYSLFAILFSNFCTQLPKLGVFFTSFGLVTFLSPAVVVITGLFAIIIAEQLKEKVILSNKWKKNILISCHIILIVWTQISLFVWPVFIFIQVSLRQIDWFLYVAIAFLIIGYYMFKKHKNQRKQNYIYSFSRRYTLSLAFFIILSTAVIAIKVIDKRSKTSAKCQNEVFLYSNEKPKKLLVKLKAKKTNIYGQCKCNPKEKCISRRYIVLDFYTDNGIRTYPKSEGVDFLAGEAEKRRTWQNPVRRVHSRVSQSGSEKPYVGSLPSERGTYVDNRYNIEFYLSGFKSPRNKNKPLKKIGGNQIFWHRTYKAFPQVPDESMGAVIYCGGWHPAITCRANFQLVNNLNVNIFFERRLIAHWREIFATIIEQYLESNPKWTEDKIYQQNKL